MSNETPHETDDAQMPLPEGTIAAFADYAVHEGQRTQLRARLMSRLRMQIDQSDRA